MHGTHNLLDISKLPQPEIQPTIASNARTLQAPSFTQTPSNQELTHVGASSPCGHLGLRLIFSVPQRLGTGILVVLKR
jgi:hypothetical protein